MNPNLANEIPEPRLEYLRRVLKIFEANTVDPFDADGSTPDHPIIVSTLHWEKDIGAMIVLARFMDSNQSSFEAVCEFVQAVWPTDTSEVDSLDTTAQQDVEALLKRLPDATKMLLHDSMDDLAALVAAKKESP